MSFDELFQQSPDGSYATRPGVSFEGTMISRVASNMPSTVVFSLDSAQLAGKFFEVEKHSDGTVEIKRIHK